MCSLGQASCDNDSDAHEQPSHPDAYDSTCLPLLAVPKAEHQARTFQARTLPRPPFSKRTNYRHVLHIRKQSNATVATRDVGVTMWLARRSATAELISPTQSHRYAPPRRLTVPGLS